MFNLSDYDFTTLDENLTDIFTSNTTDYPEIDFNETNDNSIFNSTTENYLFNITEDIKYLFTTNESILIYTMCIIASIILTTLRSLLFFKVCMNASRGLHNKMFNNILQATMRFFDTNPSGNKQS